MWRAPRHYRRVGLCSVCRLALRQRLLAAAFASVVACVPARVAGAGPQAVHLDVRIDGTGAPFSAAELVAAVALRLPVAAAAADQAAEVVVSAPAPGLVVIQRGAHRREVEVGTTGSALDAARLVALMIVDLVGPELVLPPGPPEQTPAASARVAGGGTAAWGSRLSAATVLALATGTTDAGLAAQPTIEARWAARPKLRVVLSVGFDRAEALLRDAAARESTLGLSTLPLRLGAGVRLGPAELRTGALARPYFASGADGSTGVLWGGWTSVSLEVPVTGALVPFAVVGLDIHPGALAFQIDGQTVLAVERLAPWLGVGLSWRGRAA